LTNDEVIAVDQHSTGGRQVLDEAQKIVWIAHADKPGAAYVALFNLADVPQTIEYPLQPVGLGSISYAIRDLWEHKNLGVADRVHVDLRPHAGALFRVTAAK
jgi:hypothetical protein